MRGGGATRHLHVEDGELRRDEVVPRDEFVAHGGQGSHVRLDPERPEAPGEPFQVAFAQEAVAHVRRNRLVYRVREQEAPVVHRDPRLADGEVVSVQIDDDGLQRLRSLESPAVVPRRQPAH
ncbi:hypothetical protein [Candidatus Palauibacter soopunensis]|uniref:hypothetical protein n=1 Tax=Candidatus Palauibacter soopunensis TaxID=3056739 RepID=UPI00238C44EF|nr:hypothetical protein [Candidatus Palauibacter soopunensis]MDE2878906.1 hypothetical protein [Candidatus Palauibacter soopunensis]